MATQPMVLQVPPKVRVFVWKLLNGALPTEVTFMARHVPISSHCFVCGYWAVDSNHIFFRCPATKPFSKSTVYWRLIKQVTHLPTPDLMHFCTSVMENIILIGSSCCCGGFESNDVILNTAHPGMASPERHTNHSWTLIGPPHCCETTCRLPRQYNRPYPLP